MNRIQLLCIGLLLSGSVQAGKQLNFINLEIEEIELKQIEGSLEKDLIQKRFDLQIKRLELILTDEDVTDERINLMLRQGMGINYPGIYPITIIAPMKLAGKTNKEIYIAVWTQLESDRIARLQKA